MFKKRFSIIAGGIRIFLESNSFDRAAAISFYAFFSLVPLLLLMVAGLGFIFGKRTDLLERVIEMARASLPYITDRVINDLRGLSSAYKTFGWFSIAMLFLSAEMVLNSLA